MYADVPPLTVNETAPFVFPKQEASVTVVVNDNGLGCVIVIVVVVVQPFASLTV